MNKTTLTIKKILATLALLFISLLGFSQSTQTWSTPGTYTFTVPVGVVSIDVSAWGGGGAGGGATGNNAAGGGGAGGGFAKNASFTVVPGTTYTITVGAGGIGDKNSGNPGSSSSLTIGGTTYLLAVGGNGGNLASSDNSSANGASAVSTGNSGFTTTLNYYGGAGGDGLNGGSGGSSAGTSSNGNAPVDFTGGVAVAGGGSGADGTWWNGNGANGFNPGGGGAGAYASGNKDKAGGSGGNGQVIISWLCPIFSLSTTITPATLCSTFGANVSVTSTALGLPVGTYTVTYNLSGSNTATGSTATMVVSTAGAGSFTTNAIPLAGVTTITITNLSKLTCSNAVVANNTAVVTLTATPSILTTTPNNRIGTGTVALSATASAGTISWFATLTGGVALQTGTSYTTTSISTTTTYYVQTTNGSCTSSPRVAVTATVNNPEIAVSGNGFTINDGDTSTNTSDFTDLGSTFVNVNLTRTYIIQNIGAATLTVGAITIGGANASEFVVTNPPTTIAPGTNALFTITFKPTVIGTRNATVSFVTDDSDENPFNFNISGTGIPGVKPEINIQGLGVDIVDGASAGSATNDTDFGTPLAGVSVVKTFTIQNKGTGTLTLSGIPKVTITGDAAFTVTSQPSGTIAASGTTTFQVTFNSALTGNFLAIVSIINDDDNESIYDFVVTAGATVAGREIDIQGNDVTIIDGDTTPSTLDQTDFGITDATTKIAIPYQVFNYGNASLTLTPTISITGTGAPSFTATALPTSLASGAGNVTSFVITYNPAVAGVGIRTATITITNNDNVGTPSEIAYNFDVRAESKIFSAQTVAPGGVTTNLKYWIKADSNIGSVGDNTDIMTWQDNTTGNTKNAIAKLGKEPKFFNNPTNNVNFNPVIHFNGANAMAGGQGFNNLDMFVVIKPTKTVTSSFGWYDIYCGDDVASNKPAQDVTGFEMGDTSSRFTNEVLAYNQASTSNYGVAEISTTKSYAGANIFNPNFNSTTKMGINNNGKPLTTIEKLSGSSYVAYKNIVNSRYWLGASETFGPSYDGDILEIINYSASNTPTNRLRIDSYLAIKYGITLGVNGTSVDYYNSTSTNTATAIYTAGAGYNYNIAGIGRDDASQLNQKQSKTENTNDDVTMGLTNIYDRNSDNPNAFGGDKNYLVWGNNNGTLLAQPAVVVNMSSGISPALISNVDFISIGRTWRVVETGGDVPSVKVSIPSTLLTSTITPPGDFLMFISNSPVFNPTSEYRVMRVNGSKLEADYDFNGVKYITFGYAPEKTFVRSIDFDGANDYLDAGKVLDLNTSFTVSAWVKNNGINQTILSKRNSAFTAGYDLGINNSGKVEMSWMNGTKQSIVSSLVLPTNIWHNIAVTYNGTTAKLYIDGVEDTSVALSNVPANPTQSFLIAAADGLTPTSYFKGTIDEVRIWTATLTDKQLRYVMNQEMSNNASFVNGSIIPNNITNNDISSIPWSNVAAYYPMSTYTFTNAKDISNNNYTAALKNLTTVDRQTAPLPYESASNGDWQTASTWLNNTVQDIPNSISFADDTRNVDWNIVKTTHNVTTTTNKTVLGLVVSSNILGVTNDSKIEVSHYLKLDGKIDLVGMSQLIQTEGSDLDVTSSGSMERDQQGQSNKYNYNYWSSPVSPINNTVNNNDYTVAGILKDGTTATPQNITWLATGVDGSPTAPISLAEYWLWTFESADDIYANWKKVTSTTPLKVTQGFTLKGSGATGAQNYTFVGKPNNGTITTNTVVADQLFLTGNPYPSALDSNKFITDNLYLSTTDDTGADGTLYFWEHSSSNNTHTLKDYLGGYAVRNLLTGLPPVVPAGISGVGLSSKIPNQYIPVGQGFFVYGKTSGGGPIIFKNSQRAFQKEDSVDSNTLFKTNPNYKKHKTPTNNDNDPVEKNNFKIIRLGFDSSNKYHRQVVLGFADDKATSGIDYGYDSYMLDDFANDMYLLNGEEQLAIEGEGYFKNTASYPVGVKAKADGKVKFMLDGLENFDPQQAIYIYDDLTKIYHDIRTEGFEVDLAKGENTSRFSIRFKQEATEKTLSVEEIIIKENTIKTSYIQNKNTLVINNTTTDTLIEKVTLYSILGQSIANWEVKNQDQQNIQLPIKTINSGVYIAKIKTSNGDLSKKIIVK